MPRLVQTTLKVRPIDRSCGIVDIDDIIDAKEDDPPVGCAQNDGELAVKQPAVEERDAIDNRKPAKESANDIEATASIKPQQRTSPLSKFLKPIQRQEGEDQPFSYEFTEEIDIFKPPPQRKPRYASFCEMLSSPDKMPNTFLPRVAYESEYKDQLVNALINAGVSYQQADETRRMLVAHFETLEELSHAPKEQLTNGFEVKQNADVYEEAINQERRRNINAYCAGIRRQLGAELEQTCQFSTAKERLGFSTGVASIYIPGRVFFGYTPDPRLSCTNIYLQPLSIEDEVNYEEETHGFDERSAEEDESDGDSGASDTGSGSGSERLGESLAVNKPAGTDDLERSEDDDFDEEAESGMQRVPSMRKQKEMFDFLNRREREFAFPTPLLCPETVAGVPEVLTVYGAGDRAFPRLDTTLGDGEFEVVRAPVIFDGERDGEVTEEDGVRVHTGATINWYLRPVVVDSNGLGQCSQDFEFVVDGTSEESAIK